MKHARLGNIQRRLLLKGMKPDGLGLFTEGGALGPAGAHQLGALVHDEKNACGISTQSTQFVETLAS